MSLKDISKQYGIWLLPFLIILLAPVFFNSGFAFSVMGQMGVAIIFTVAYNMLLGQGGMLSFGHAIYFGLAGYSTIHIMNNMLKEDAFYFPVSLLPILGGLVGLLFGIIIGYVSTRRAGTTFAMISLGFGEMVTALTLILIAFFNGEEGIQGDRMIGPEPFGIDYGSDIQVFYLIGIWCLVAIIGMYAITKTPFGRMSNAVRDNPERTQFVGFNTQRVRWMAFALSSFFAGIAGSLHALNFEHVGFETVGAAQSGFVLFMAFIGGSGYFLGPILGAMIITFLTASLGEVSEAWFLYLGIFFIMMVLFAPGGLAGIVMIHEPIWKVDYRLLKHLAKSYSAGIGATLLTAIGATGMIELVYFTSHHVSGETTFSLFWVTVDITSVLPWLTFILISGGGGYLCMKTYPLMAKALNEVMEDIKNRMAV